ncbi:MAG: hypothetical protein U1B80_04240, partial [Anaerolineaceae bacterium]|nr:hypothetical protein [Anaerolineaceae bacterium]
MGTYLKRAKRKRMISAPAMMISAQLLQVSASEYPDGREDRVQSFSDIQDNRYNSRDVMNPIPSDN